MRFENLSRRHLLIAGGVATTALALAPHAFAEGDKAALAEEAAIWGLPLVQTGRYFSLARKAGAEPNRFYLNPDLATPSLKVAGPNVDTIYGYAWLDLAAEPVVLDVPDTNDRYYSIQLLDTFENTFAYVGRRETGTKAGSFLIAGPDWKGKAPAGAKLIRSPTSLVLAFTRTLVRGVADAPAAQALQEKFTLAALSAGPDAGKPGIVKADALNVLPILDFANAGAGYFDELAELISRYGVPEKEKKTLAKFAALGLGVGKTSDPSLKPVLEAALSRALARIKTSNASTIVNGWRVNYTITNFIKDPLARAATNQYGPGAHIAEEALYFSAIGDNAGAPLSGASSYTLTFPAGQLPPVDGFWSLTLYGQDFFLVDNPISRYAIHDRTPGLVNDASGALKLVIQHDTPTDPADKANWLPAPAGPFQLILRTYQPRANILDKSYKLPSVRKASA